MTYSLTTKVMRFLQAMLMNGFAQGNIEQELMNSTKDQVFFHISRRAQLREVGLTIEADERYPSLPSGVSFQQLTSER